MGYIYFEPLELNENESLIFELLHIARKYDVLKLELMCEEVLMETLNISNCVYRLLSTQDLNLKKFKENCLNFIVKNLEILISKDALEPLPKKMLMEIIKNFKQK